MASSVESSGSRLPQPARFVSVAANVRHTLFVDADGLVWAAGFNSHGQLGAGGVGEFLPMAPTYVPVTLAGMGGKVTAAVTGFSHSLLLCSSGRLLASGFMRVGSQWRSESAANWADCELSDVVQVACGDQHALALDNAGGVWAVGRNLHGQLGRGDVDEVRSWVRSPLDVAVRSVAAGHADSFAIDVDDRLWVCGSNSRGQLGVGFCSPCRDWMLAPFGDVRSVSVGFRHSLAVDASGRLWSAGAGSSMAGLGESPTVFVPVTGLADVVAAAAGTVQSLALCSDGRVWSVSSSSDITDGACWSDTGLVNVVSVAAGGVTAFAVDEQGVVWVSGERVYGSLGLPAAPGLVEWLPLPSGDMLVLVCALCDAGMEPHVALDVAATLVEQSS